ncbi:MAG: S8 family serine peptidase [Spirochaetales bacterium]|nr:S8 family serine peptidase [Spirochaetales bacterium]
MRNFFLLLCAILIVIGITGLISNTAVGNDQSPTEPDQPKDNTDELKKKQLPETVIMGYEESAVLVCIDPALNSVETLSQAEEILQEHIDLLNIDITRVVKPEKKIKIKDEEIKIKLKDEDLENLDKYEKKLFALYKIKIKDKDLSIKKFQETVKNDSKILYTQKNYKYQQTYEPDDPEYVSGKLWGITATQTNLAWDLSRGYDVVVAVVDTGVDYNHPDLADNLWNNGSGNCGYDFSDLDDDPLDYAEHGTHVAGIIASVMDNSLGVVGVAPQVKIMAVKVFPNAYSDVLAQGIKYAADEGADVINNSWGLSYRRPDDPVVTEAIDYAYNAGCVIVNSAGNSNDDAGYYFGANHPDVICVTGVDSNLEKSGTANYGEVVDVAAPGENIYSLKPGGSYQYLTGTSMAAAYVSGLAALVKAYNQTLTNTGIRQAIIDSATPLSEPLFYNAGFMDSYEALTGGSVPSPPPDPGITNIPPVDTGEDISIYGENFITESMVIIEGNGVHEYATILSRTTDTIVVENQYNYGTYQVQVENVYKLSNTVDATINYVPPANPPEIAAIPDIEEDDDITIYGNNYDTSALVVHITGNGFDEDAEITFSCKTAVKIENYFFAGDYQIEVYNGWVKSNSAAFTIYEMGTMPDPVYKVKNGNDGPFNWLTGTSSKDEINGFGGTDYIFGYGDSDILNGGTGSDVFVYGENHGLDVIEDSSGEDMISIIGIEPDDVTPSVEGYDYVLYVPNGRILIKDQFVEPNSVIEVISFW